MGGGKGASTNNVHFLKTNSGKKGQGMPVVRNSKFYFREGFCWIDVNSTYLKARIKDRGVFDVLSMSLFSMTEIPDWYYVSLINSELISLYVDNFINNTSHFQINDARQLPVIIPSQQVLDRLSTIVKRAEEIKKHEYFGRTSETELDQLQVELDTTIAQFYSI